MTYLEKAIKATEEFDNKNLSIKELECKLISKGIRKEIIDNYICSNKETLLEYEIKSAINIINKIFLFLLFISIIPPNHVYSYHILQL